MGNKRGSNASADPVTLALDHMIKLDKLVKKCQEYVDNNWKGEEKEKPSATGDAVSRRAKDLPGLTASAGLVPALTFYMAKAGESEDIYRSIYMYLAGAEKLSNLVRDCLTQDGKRAGRLLQEIQKEKGYATILAATTLAMKELGLLGNADPSSFKDLAVALKKLHENAREELIAERRLLEYLTETKKLAEAFFSKGEGG